LPQLEERWHELPSSIVDLSEVEQGQRALTWDIAVRSAFPGLSVKLADPSFPLGSIHRLKMGDGEFCEIESAAADVTHHPSKQTPKAPLSVMVLARGQMEVKQAAQSCSLNPGDMCVIDESRGFRLIGEESSRILFLRLPRSAALSRYPLLEKLFVTRFPADEPGTRILASTLLRFSTEAVPLRELQRRAMMNGVIQMLGMAEPFYALPATPDWRVRRALDYIELNLSVPGLTAESVAGPADQPPPARSADARGVRPFDCQPPVEPPARAGRGRLARSEPDRPVDRADRVRQRVRGRGAFHPRVQAAVRDHAGPVAP
jgi:hypothetical protein